MREKVVALGLTSVVSLGALIAAWMLIYSPQNQPALSTSDTASQPKTVNQFDLPVGLADAQAVKQAGSAVEALSATFQTPGSMPPDNSGGAPVFDVARIGANGDAVIAGHAEPGASIE